MNEYDATKQLAANQTKGSGPEALPFGPGYLANTNYTQAASAQHVNAAYAEMARRQVPPLRNDPVISAIGVKNMMMNMIGCCPALDAIRRGTFGT